MFEDIKEFFKWIFDPRGGGFQVILLFLTITFSVILLVGFILFLCFSGHAWALILLPITLYKFAFEHWKKNVKKS